MGKRFCLWVGGFCVFRVLWPYGSVFFGVRAFFWLWFSGWGRGLGFVFWWFVVSVRVRGNPSLGGSRPVDKLFNGGLGVPARL